jgi:hypothetical protein
MLTILVSPCPHLESLLSTLKYINNNLIPLSLFHYIFFSILWKREKHVWSGRVTEIKGEEEELSWLLPQGNKGLAPLCGLGPILRSQVWQAEIAQD